jgi:hypothetical protein
LRIDGEIQAIVDEIEVIDTKLANL